MVPELKKPGVGCAPLLMGMEDSPKQQETLNRWLKNYRDLWIFFSVFNGIINYVEKRH